jgi:dihydrofolate reductase
MYEESGERLTLVAVVAAARNGVIGNEGAMPWRLRGDLRRYRQLTMGRPMIMGRKTLASIGRVLDGRDTVVLTRTGVAPIEGALAAGSPEEALRLAAACARARETNEIVIAGGAEIYALFLDRIDRIERTVVDAAPPGDAVFPRLDPAEWLEGPRTAFERAEGDSDSAFHLTLTRRAG